MQPETSWPSYSETVKVCGFDGHKSGNIQIWFLHWKPVSVRQKTPIWIMSHHAALCSSNSVTV
jgi:hypothetical protein